jgi:hypothetical protein
MSNCIGVNGTMTQSRATATLTQLIVFGIICHGGWSVPLIPQYVYYDDDVTWYRKGVRDGYYVIDIRLTASPGWAGDENTDWKCLYSIKSDT